MIKTVLALVQAFLMLISHFSVVDSGFKERVDMAAIGITSQVNFSFDEITAEETVISQEEKQLCREWYEKNVLLKGGKPAYDFTVKGRKFSKNTEDWDISLGEESEEGALYKGGKTSYITINHKKSSLSATVEATIYEDFATCEWTVYIKNNGKDNSDVIKDFYGADCMLDMGKTELYVSRGSSPCASDFELNKTPVNSIPMTFNANGGRSESYLPFFNLDGEKFGAVLSVGWTGQWFTSLEQTKSGVNIKAKQENFKAYLTPGEEVRSPLVSLSFYKGGNPLKGFNTLRSWETKCVCPESVKSLNGYVIANEFSKLTTDDFIAMLDRVNPVTLENTDYFWMDAGWYEYNEGWHDGVGNWIPDKSRFPDGLKPLGDKIKSMGKKFLLWYEPERVREGTYLYNEGMKHEGWIIQDGSDFMWNLGNDEACEFLSSYIGKSLAENGVTMYRQDFNFTPSPYWEKADKLYNDKRTGICENHYVTNLYKYLDSLAERIDGLIIDNCASGGKRLDIEMARRSIPLWRSDYNCGNADGTVKPDVLEATQAMTYGLSCWLPYSGTNRYFHSEYASRTAILTNQSVYEPDTAEYAKYDDISNYMTENYYPLTYGGLNTDKYTAMQFGNGERGAALIYKRENVDGCEYILKLNGLDPDNNYTVYDIDSPENKFVLSGRSLMTSGITLEINETPKACVVKYSVL